MGLPCRFVSLLSVYKVSFSCSDLRVFPCRLKVFFRVMLVPGVLFYSLAGDFTLDCKMFENSNYHALKDVLLDPSPCSPSDIRKMKV